MNTPDDPAPLARGQHQASGPVVYAGNDKVVPDTIPLEPLWGTSEEVDPGKQERQRLKRAKRKARMTPEQAAEQRRNYCCRSESCYMRTAWSITTKLPETNDYGCQFKGMWQCPLAGGYLKVGDKIVKVDDHLCANTDLNDIEALDGITPDDKFVTIVVRRKKGLW